MDNAPMLSGDEIVSIFEKLKSTLDTQRIEAGRVDSWLKPDSSRGFAVPKRASSEHRALAGLSRTPWLSLVVNNVSQSMYVDNIINESGDESRLWQMWVNNGMVGAQIANHRAFVAYGHSYMVVTPAVLNGIESVRMRCLSPKRLACMWDDEASDFYPRYALEAMTANVGETRYRLYDSHYIYNLYTDDGRPVVASAPTHHGVGLTPVVRFANQIDLDGQVVGEVTPFIPTASRINKTAYDRLLAQHFNSWKVKTIAGLDMPEHDNPTTEAQMVEEAKMKLSHEDMLISEDPATKFGTLDGTDLGTFVQAWRSDIEALAAASQTPAHALTGQLVNLSPEALAAARAPLTQKVYERQVGAGDTYSRGLRLAASIAGYDDLAVDVSVRTTWQDMEIRSMSQAVDALGKAATMLKIPYKALWGKIPGVQRYDLDEWEREAERQVESDPINSMLRRHSADTAQVSGEEVE